MIHDTLRSDLSRAPLKNRIETAIDVSLSMSEYECMCVLAYIIQRKKNRETGHFSFLD